MKKERNEKGKYVKMDNSKNKRIRVTDLEYRKILTDRFIRQVDECNSKNWENSDLEKQTEENLVIIAKHLQSCTECLNEFGNWLEDVKPSFTLIDLGDFPQNLNNWICNK